MGLLAPLFALGIALIGIPYFVHRIRRPERETVRFSSLMFVPDIKREVIERRRVQHVLLMVLRMAALAVLALAFARPFREAVLRVEATPLTATDYVIALDVSLSMGYDGVWARAKTQAKSVLDAVAPGDRVGFVRFAQRPEVNVPLSDDVDLVRRAIDAADVTWAHTDYAAALQAVEQVFAADLPMSSARQTDTAQVRRIVHVISDFQASGMPVSDTGWRLPGAIKLHAVDVGAAHVSNASVDALAVRVEKNDGLRVRARVQNRSGQDALAVQLVVNGQTVETREVTVLQGNATQVAFDLRAGSGLYTASVPSPRGITGYVALVGGDGLARDDRGFFVSTTKPQHPIQVWHATDATRFLLKAALPERAPWRLYESGQGPSSVIVAEDVDATSVGVLADYVERGGALFLPLRKNADMPSVNALLARAQIQISGVRDAGYAQLAWVRLAHAIFHPFRGARFNDFSSVRYDSYHIIAADSSAVVLAKYDDDLPAMVEGTWGKGRILIWAGGMGLDRSNLARTPRFVPLLHETLRYLAGDREIKTAYLIGDAIEPQVQGATKQVMGPEPLGSEIGDIRQFRAPGIYEWGGQIAAVNVADRESDLTRITPAEFEIRLCHAPALFQGDGERAPDPSRHAMSHEYGRWTMGLLFALLLLEHFFASRSKARDK